MSLIGASNILREIRNDRQDPTKRSPFIFYDIHLKALDSWHAELPICLCLRASIAGGLEMVDPDSNYRQMTAIVRSTLLNSTARHHAYKTYSTTSTLSSMESSASYCNRRLVHLRIHP